MADGKLVKSYIAYLTKKLPGSPALATARIAPKICQGQSSRIYSRVLQISSILVHCEWSYSRTCEHHQNGP